MWDMCGFGKSVVHLPALCPARRESGEGEAACERWRSNDGFLRHFACFINLNTNFNFLTLTPEIENCTGINARELGTHIRQDISCTRVCGCAIVVVCMVERKRGVLSEAQLECVVCWAT